MPLNFNLHLHLIGGCEWYSMSRKPRSQGNIGCAGNWGKLEPGRSQESSGTSHQHQGKQTQNSHNWEKVV